MRVIGERKAAAARLAELTGKRAVFTKMPRCAYEVSPFAIERDGTVTVSESADLAPLRTLAQEGLLEGWEETVGENTREALEATTEALEATREVQEAVAEVLEEQEAVPEALEAQEAPTETQAAPTETVPEALETQEAQNAPTEEQAAPTEAVPKALEEQNATAEAQHTPTETQEAQNAPDALTISMPLTGHTANSLRNLVTMIYSRGPLLSKATGGTFAGPLEQVEALKDRMTVSDAVASITPDLTGLTITDDAITFTGFPLSVDPEKIQAFTQLAAQMNRLAKEQKRTQAKTVDTSNEKYIFRIWLLALGMGGDEFKTARKVLLAPLSGNAAFKDEAMERRWKEKQAAKRAYTSMTEEATTVE